MNAPFFTVASEDDAPRTFGGHLANLIGAGRLDRKAAQHMRTQGMAALKAADAKLSAAKLTASAALDEFHTHKALVYSEKVEEFSRAYDFVGQPGRSVYSAMCESSKLEKTLEGPKPPSQSSSLASIAGGVCVGGVLGSALSYGLLAAGVLSAAFAPALVGALVVVPGLALAMRSGVKDGAKQRTAARRFVTETGQHLVEVDSRCHELGKVQPGVLAMNRAIADLGGTLSRTVEEALEPVLQDSFNACELLMSILDTPLLDGEGAFLEGVIEKLHGHRAAIGEIHEKLAA